jgi:hypothetical protein
VIVETPDFVACRIQVKVSSGSAFVVHRDKYKGMLLVYVWHIEVSTQTIAFASCTLVSDRLGRKRAFIINGRHFKLIPRFKNLVLGFAKNYGPFLKTDS